MLSVKLSAALLVAMFVTSSVTRADDRSDDSTDDDDDDDDEKLKLPSNITELFADVYNNNSISRYLKSREAFATTPTITEVAPGVFLASKYCLGNSLWIVTPQNSIIIIDAPESVEVATTIRNDMRKLPAIGNKPIKFLIYTLFHADHTYGAAAFVNDPANGGQQPAIIGHKNLPSQTDVFDIYRFMKITRVHRVFGTFLPPSVMINAYVPLRLGQVQLTQYFPNILLDLNELGETTEAVLEGVPLKFIYTPGYTEDQIAVWIPGSKVLACADHFYELLPNIYTIRGEPSRDALAWAKSTRLLRSYNAEVLSPSHNDPLIGRQQVSEILEKLADIMQYLHDQTVRLMAKGLTVDAISRQIQLPASLANEPLLPPIYGAVEGHVRSIAELYTGWFNGEAEDLVPVSKSVLASNMVRDFGRNKLVSLARKAYKAGDYRWALTLASYVWRAENKSRNDALYWRTQAIKRIADNTAAGQWRNYLFASTIVDWGFAPVQFTVMASRPFYLGLRTIQACFELLAIHVNSAVAEGVDLTIDLKLTGDPDLNSDEFYRLRLRNSVLNVDKVSSNDLSNFGGVSYSQFQISSINWRALLANRLTVSQAVASGALVTLYDGGVTLQSFLNNFDLVDQA